MTLPPGRDRRVRWPGGPAPLPSRSILDGDGVLPEDAFWDAVAARLSRYRDDHLGAIDRLDLFTERFAHSCLNRLQLRNTTSMVDLTDQASSLMFAGTLENPVARAAARLSAAPAAV